MKLAEYNLLSLRCAMTKLGYQWKRDRDDRSLMWERIDHWSICDPAPGYNFQTLHLHPVCSAEGELMTTDVGCGVAVYPDLSLDRWFLWECHAGCSIDLDPWTHRLEDLPRIQSKWIKSLRRS